MRRRTLPESTRTAWRTLTSMRTALLLLFLLALAAVPGSLFPQENLDPGAVTRYVVEHPTLGVWLSRLGFFRVYTAPWFLLIYVLLGISLVGCLTPRIRFHAAALRGRPPAPPRALTRLGYADTWTSERSADDVTADASRLLRRRRWRVQQHDLADGARAVAAEKGYARDTGNLVFHVALLGLLVAVGYGSAFGFTAHALIVEGDTFTNTDAAYDDLRAGRFGSPQDLPPFSVTLDDFDATFLPNGQPADFRADVRYARDADQPAQQQRIRVNHPLTVERARVYLLDHGYAPQLVVRDRAGRVVHDAATPFVTKSDNLLSLGVVKIPDAGPVQLGVQGVFFPTLGVQSGQAFSRFPDPQLPALSYVVWAGDLGLDSGAPQNVYELDTTRLVRAKEGLAVPGETVRGLPGGATMTFVGYREWALFRVSRDPGKMPALVFAALALGGLVVSLRGRRRRVWVRTAAGPGGTVVTVGGLARQDAEGFAPEFAAVRGALLEAAPAATPAPLPAEEHQP